MAELTNKIYTRQDIEARPDDFTWSKLDSALIDKNKHEIQFRNFALYME